MQQVVSENQGCVRYASVTGDIQITVVPAYVEENSVPNDNYYVWAYSVNILNCGDSPVKVMKREWITIDCKGVRTIVSGEGIVGECPVIKPGEEFEYTSGTYLNAPSGVMIGKYYFKPEVDDDSVCRLIVAEVPTFSLDSPHDNPLNH